MARLVYACKIELSPTAGVEAIIDAYQAWIENHYRQRRGLSDFHCDLNSNSSSGLPTLHQLKASRYSTKSGAAAVIEWEYPADTDETLRWRNDIRIGAFESYCNLEHLIWIDSIEYQVSPARIELGSPSIIRRLCTEHVVRVGDMQIRATPYPLKEDGINHFLDLLQSPLRKLPLLVLAPFSNGHPNLVNAELMARRLAGTSIVIQIGRAEVTHEISDIIGRTMSCFNGGVRLYWPHFTTSDDPRRHPLYLGAKIEAAGSSIVAQSIERRVFAVAAFRFVSDTKTNAIIREADQLQRASLLDTQRATTGVDWETYAIEIDSELSAAKQRLNELEAENQNLRANQEVFLTGGVPTYIPEDILPEEMPVPETVLAAVEIAMKNCRNLIILEDARFSAESSPFLRPAEIADALYALDQVADKWRSLKAEKGNGGDLRQHLIDIGWGKRCSMHISDTTRAKHKNSYTFTYESERRLFEPHITLGSGDANSCASIHFVLDERKEKIVIAHVGRHLPNTKT